MKEYHFIISYSELNGWIVDVDSEETKFPDGTIYNNELQQWEFAYLGDGRFNGIEEELMSQLSEKINELNGDD